MERIIRVVLFVVLALLGLDHAQTQRELDALKPPHRGTTLEQFLAYYSSSALPPRPPIPPPPPPPLDFPGGAP